MTQAHLDLQLEPSSSDLTSQPLFNDSPVLFLEPIDQLNAQPSEEVEQIKHTTPSKIHTPPDNTHEVPPPPEKRYEKKEGSCFSFLTYIPSKNSFSTIISTTRDDLLIPLLSQDNFTFKAQLTSLYMHPTDYTFRLYNKNQDFFTSIASNIMASYKH